MCKNTTFPHNTKIMMPRACKRLPPAPPHPSDGGIPEGRKGCAPSSPGIEPIPDKDGAHPGRGWRISFPQISVRAV
jgi:hypothetical protein